MSLRPTEDPPDDEFTHETRMVVLNFLSLFPLDGQSSSSGSLASSGSSLERSPGKLNRQQRITEMAILEEQRDSSVASDGEDGFSWEQTLPSLPTTSLVERVVGSNDMGHDTVDYRGASMPNEDEPDIGHQRPSNLQLANSFGSRDSTEQSPPQRKKLPQRSFDRLSYDRQTSNTSESSDVTDMSDVSSLMMSSRSGMSHRSNYVDVLGCHENLDPLVKRGALPPQVLPLQQQLNREMERELHRQHSVKGKSPSPNPRAVPPPNPSPTHPPPLSSSVSVMTPQSEVAEQLRIIGDSVQTEYGADIEKAFQAVMSVKKSDLSYTVVEQILLELVDHIPGLSQRAAVVMLLSQRLAMYGRDLHSLVNYTVKFLTDRMASFILSRGGWGSILALDDPLSTPVTPNEVRINVHTTDDIDGASLLPGPPQGPDLGGMGVLPGPPIHTVSTSSSTLVEDFDTEQTISSMIDSGFLPGTSFTETSTTFGIGRDNTMDSIASIQTEVFSPAGTVDMVDNDSEAPQAPNGRDGLRLRTNLPYSDQNDSDAPDTTSSEVDKIRREIFLMRQISDAPLSPQPAPQSRSEIAQTAGKFAVVGGLACCALYVIYKKLK